MENSLFQMFELLTLFILKEWTDNTLLLYAMHLNWNKDLDKRIINQ